MPVSRTLATDAYYHLYNRGVDGRNIFLRHENYLYFLKLFRKYCTADQATLVAYCLMPNHYHILLKIRSDTFGKTVMAPFGSAYAQAINAQQKRRGPLFQGRYQAKHVAHDRYLVELSRYIHLNPVRARLCKHPQDWQYSSYQDYIGLRNGSLPNPNIVLDQFPSVQAYADYIESAQPRSMSKHLKFD